jgi:dienelactone hydrolase
MIARRAWLLALFVAAVGCGGGGGGGPAPLAEPDGSFAVGTTNFVFVDTSRPTAANKSVPAKDSRTLRTGVYYPASGEGGVGAPAFPGHRYPLIVFAHGFMALGRFYGTILHAWAAAGYVVAAPDFPLSNGLAEGGPNASDVVNQPADESFIIDQMLALNGEPSSVVHALIDSAHIGASGQSLGGMTTFGLAFNTCCHDSRIDAAVPMAGALMLQTGALILQFASEYDPDIGPPVLLINGDHDESVDYQDAIDAYDRLAPPKLLLTHVGGMHIPPYVGAPSVPALAATIDASTAFFDLYLKNERGARERLLAVGTRANVTLQHDF